MFHNTGITAETASAPLVVKGAQLVWLTLNDARERAFTGEIVFETDPEVFAYAAAQVTHMLEVTKRLGGDGCVLHTAP